MTWKLLEHAVVKTARAFWPNGQHHPSHGWSLHSPVPVAARSALAWGLACESDERKRMQEEVLASAWCTRTFIRKMQIAFIRRMVAQYWDPFLERDGLKKCAESPPAFMTLLDRVAYDSPSTEEINLEIRLTDNETRDSWTRIRIWPWQGRIMIRDQLLNKSFEKTLQFLQCIIIDQTCLEQRGPEEMQG